jgi:hypothetical protein
MPPSGLQSLRALPIALAKNWILLETISLNSILDQLEVQSRRGPGQSQAHGRIPEQAEALAHENPGIF